MERAPCTGNKSLCLAAWFAIALPMSSISVAAQETPGSASKTVVIYQNYGSYKALGNLQFPVPLEPEFAQPPDSNEDSYRRQVAQLRALAADEDEPVTGVSPAPVYIDFGEKGLQLHFTFAQRDPPHQSLQFDGVSYARDDNVSIYVARLGSAATTLLATTNPNGKCSSRSYVAQLTTTHNECATSLLKEGKLACPASAHCWGGTLSISFGDLDSNDLLGGVQVRVERTLWVHDAAMKDDAPVLFASTITKGGETTEWLSIPMRRTTDFRSEQYIQAGPNIGYVPSAPHHRSTLNLYLPMSSRVLISSTFADASGTVLTVRDKSLKSVFSDQASALKCAACSSFQTDSSTTSEWQPAVSSKTTLGIDFQKLGVDSAPFTFDAVGYPVDSGYKFIAGGLGIADMNGTTQKTGLAHDQVLAASQSLGGNGNKVTIGLFDVNANRSALPQNQSALFAAVPAPIQHSHNTELSVGFTNTQGASAIGDPTFPTAKVSTFGALLRYGTQYIGAGQRVDVAVANGFFPGYSDFDRPLYNRQQWSEALGYRDVGAHYEPLDAAFDPLQGLQGFYGALQYTEPKNTGPKGPHHPVTASVAFHRFTDAVEARDVAVSLNSTYQLSPVFSWNASLSTGNLAVSQAGRLTSNIVVPDSAGGAAYLPNRSYATSVAYKGSTLSANIGYSQNDAQNCNTKVAIAPCYAYRQPSVTGGVFWQPMSFLLVSGAVQNESNFAYTAPSIPGTALGTLQQTTAAHIVRKAGLGLKIPGLNCATLTLTTENRGGDVDSFAASPPQPGFTNTAALDIAPQNVLPSILVAYSRQGNLGATMAPTSTFFVRLLVGVNDRGQGIVEKIKELCS